MKKKCFKCEVEQDLSCFYKHKGMKDGFLNKCKSCCKKEAKERLDVLSKDDEWVQKERERCRERNIRLEYSKKYKKEYSSTLKYRSKYPEKYKARIKSQRMFKNKGHHLHHWNYSEGFEKDVIELTVRDHNLLHRHMIYDQSKMMYRNSSGDLLDSRQSHINLLKELKSFDISK